MTEKTTQVTPLEITPQAAVAWADAKREASLEISRCQYKQTMAERDLAAIELGYRIGVEREADELPKEDKSLSNAEKRDAKVASLMADHPRAQELRTEMDGLEDRISYLEIERTHAADMLKIMLEFAYWSEAGAKPLDLESLISSAPAGREAVQN